MNGSFWIKAQRVTVAGTIILLAGSFCLAGPSAPGPQDELESLRTELHETRLELKSEEAKTRALEAKVQALEKSNAALREQVRQFMQPHLTPVGMGADAGAKGNLPEGPRARTMPR